MFKPASSFAHPLHLTKDDGKPLYTRDQLLVSGELDGEMIHFIVNHWPSRLGGEAKSRPSREKAAALNKQIIDSLLKKDPNAKVIAMGDFNDDPINSGFKNVLKTKDKKEDVKPGELFNPMEADAQKGNGYSCLSRRLESFSTNSISPTTCSKKTRVVIAIGKQVSSIVLI